ncbi:hypothetical protein [Flagellimonas eckloniae]|nr:hypothetical protein [Allomuricauda eckloniae]
MKKSIIIIAFLFFTGFAFSQTTVTLQDQCNCEVLSGTTVTTPGVATPAGADAGDIYVNTNTGTIYFWDGDSWELTSSDDQQLTGFAFDGITNELTLTLENGGSVNVDLSSLSDTLTDTNTTVASFGIDGTNTNLVITDSDTNTFSIALADIAALVNTDDQTLSEVLTEGNDANGLVLTGLGTPTAGSDAATKAYVDGLADDDISAVAFDGTNLSVTESGTTLSADISALDDSAGVTANAGNIATNTTDIATNAGGITTNAGNIATNATDIANHIAADDDTDDTNELQDIEEVLTEGNDANGLVLTGLGTPTAGSDAATKAYVDGLADDDISAVAFDGTNLSVTESGTTLSADISALDDSAGVTANAGNIATNTTDIATNAGGITTNAGNIATNATDIANHIAADDDTDDTNELQDIEEVLTEGNDANGLVLTGLGTPTAGNDAATKAYVDGLADDDISAVAFDGTNLSVTESGTTLSADISALDDSAGVTANAGNIATNTTDIATNAGGITTNAGNIATNATDIANHIAADDDTDDTNELQDIEEVLTEGNDANGLVLTGLGTPTAGSDAATKAYVDGLADDDISAVAFDGTNLSVTESGTTLSADISALDDSAGVTANAGNIATNTTDIATNAGGITTNAGNIATNATDIANHIAADDDTDDTNEYNTGSGITAGSVQITDGGGTESVNLISADANNDIAAGTDGALYLNVASVTISETNTILGFNGATNELSYTNELGNNPAVDISALDDSAGVTANAGNIATNTTDIATNAGGITTNAGNIATNATDIANHIAADDDTDDTNELQDIEEVLTEGNDANGLVLTGLGTPTAGSDAATKAYVDGLADDDISAVAFDGTNLSVTESGTTLSADISALDDSAGVTANAGNIATNTTDIATNAGGITTNAGNIATNATDIANHIAADDDTDDTNELQDIEEVLTEGNDANGLVLTGLGTPTAGSDAATKAYVDGLADDDISAVAFDGTNLSVTESGTTLSADISALDDSAGVTANAGNIATNTTDIATNAGGITTNAGNIATNATDIANHIAADDDTDDTNELQDIEEVLTEGNDANGLVLTGLGTPTAGNDAATKAYVDGLADDDISAVAFDGTNLSVTESGTTLSADISALDDSAGVTANAGNIATNTTDIATNAGGITTNAGNIATNATDIANHIAADDDTDDTNEYNTGSGITAGSVQITDGGGTESVNLISADANNDIAAGTDGALYLNVASVTISETNTILGFNGATNELSYTNELGNNPAVDISALDDSAGVTANAGNIATNTTDIATNAGGITTNAGNIATNATDIANHIAADDDTDDTNELQDIEEVLTEGNDANGLVLTGLGTPTAGSDAATKAYVDGLADDDISAVAFDGTNLSVTESGTTLSADISALDDSAGVTANAGNIATNTTDIATNAGGITTNAGNIATNATDIANHIAADDDTDDTNEYNTGSGITAGSVQITDGGGTESVNLISADANNDIAAGTDGALYLNVASVTISETNTILGFNGATNELSYTNELGNNPAVDISALDDSAGVTANAGNIATNTTDIATNAGGITTNAGNIATNATDIANHIAADDDTDDTNELQDIEEVLTEGNDANGLVLTGLGTPTAGSDAATKAYVDGLADDDISAVAFDGTNLSVTESGTTLSADISALDDSAGVTANAGNIATNTTDIATNAGGITTNAGNIATNATDIANHIAADDDTDDTNELQDIEEVLTEGNDANGLVLTGLGTPTAGSDAATKAYVDGLADDDISAVAFDGTNLSVTESGTTLSADISALDDSAGVTANAGNIATNTTDIATNAGGITTNAGNIATNATDIANHIAADDDTDDTNELQDIEEVLTEGNDANGLVLTGLGTPTAGNDAATKAYVDGLADDDISAVAFDGTNLSVTESGTTLSADISALDDSAGVTANAGNIATNTTDIATNAGGITTNAGNIATNATDIANHIAADDDTDDTNELQDIEEVLTEGNDANGLVLTGLGTPTAGSDAATKAYVDGLADDDISAVAFDGTNLSVTESGTTLSADISALDDSAGVTANAGNIATNTTDIATNAGGITTNAGNIATNATDIANHIAADDDTDDTNELQDIEEVLTEGNDANGLVLTGLGTPTAGSDAATKAYVDGLADDDISAVAFDGTNLSVTESGTTLSADISALDDSAGVTANAGNIATNTTDIATNAGGITTNAGNIATNATDIANHIAADDDTDDTNELQDIEEVLTEGNDANGLVLTGLGTPTAGSDAATKAYVDGLADDDISAVAFDGTNLSVTESGTTLSADISALDDSAGVTANAGNIATNTTDIATNAGGITTNAGNIATNATDIANHIAADDDTDDTNELQDIEEVLTEGNDANGLVLTGLGTPTAGSDAATKAYVDGLADDDISAVAFDGTNLSVTESGTTLSADISALDDSAGVTANAGNIATNTTDIATNAGGITTNAGNIATNATDIANHIAADDDTDDTNELQDIEEVLTEGNDANGLVLTGLGTPTAGSDAATKAYVDGLADDDISAVAFDGTNLSVTESGTTLSADISALDDSAGVTANAGNIATNTTDIATNAGGITTNAGNIATNATDIANHIAADDDTDDTNEIELPTGGTSGQVLSTNGSGTYSWVDDTNDDDQTAGEVDLNTPVDVDGGLTDPDGAGPEPPRANEETVEEAIQAMAPITSKAARIFYPPSIAIDASTTGTQVIDLYAQYIAQYGTPMVRSDDGGPDEAPAAIPTYADDELYYYITYADPAVFDTTSTSGPTEMTITADGELRITVIAPPADYNSLINVVFVVK